MSDFASSRAFSCDARQDRIAVEVDEEHAAAAAHHAPRRDGRIDPAGQQARHAAAGSDRQAAGPALLAEGVERFMGQRFDADRELRIAEIDEPVPRLLDAPADLALDLRGAQRKALVGALGGHAEGGGILGTEVVQDLGRDRVHVERRASRPREVADAEHQRDPVAHLFPARAGPEHQLDAPHQDAHFRDVEVARRRADVAHEPGDEPRAVLPLERDFPVVDDDRLHFRLAIGD